jgi:hypothetical protein
MHSTLDSMISLLSVIVYLNFFTAHATDRRIRAADGWVSGVRGSAQIGWLWACTSQGR